MPPRAKTLRGQKPRPSPLTFLSHVVQACTQRILPTREGSRRGTGNETLIRHVMVSSDLFSHFTGVLDFPLNWVSEKFELSLKLGRSQAKVGVLYLERSDYYLVENYP